MPFIIRFYVHFFTLQEKFKTFSFSVFGKEMGNEIFLSENTCNDLIIISFDLICGFTKFSKQLKNTQPALQRG